MRFNNVEIAPATIAATRQHFADLAARAIAEAVSGAEPVNDLPRYIAWQEQMAADALAGKDDHTFTFMQRAYYLQTGEIVALLPR